MAKAFKALLLLAFIVSTRAAFAEGPNPAPSPPEKVPLDIFDLETSYVLESDLNHGGSFGKQDVLGNQMEYGHRFLINGNLYARAGLSYDRFDFGRTSAPVPLHLQSLAGVISLDYMHGEDIGALLEFRPGFYTENDFRSESFDCPITLARFWVIQPEKFYIMTGAYWAGLRGGWGVLPVGGFVWVPNEKLRVMAIPPEPRVVYTVNDQLEVYLGGELTGGAFRTDQHDEYKNIKHVAKLSGTQVDYADYRIGGGVTYNLSKQISADLGGGCSIEHAFLYHRAGENYRSDPAPYLRLELKAKF